MYCKHNIFKSNIRQQCILNFKKCSSIVDLKSESGQVTPGGPGGHGPLTFLSSKRKKRRQRQKRKGFKVEAIKRLSPRSKYYCFSHARASRIGTFFMSANHGGRQLFPVFHGPPTLKSISPALWIDLIKGLSGGMTWQFLNVLELFSL